MLGDVWRRLLTRAIQRIQTPVSTLLGLGATPRHLAWSIAIGLVIGVNPLLGSTTLVALALAGIFRLNILASQFGNHVVYPLELALFPVFVKSGSVVFGTAGLAMSPRAIAVAVKHQPWQTTRALWTWEWHALVVWAVLAAALAPVLALVLRPGLERMMSRLPEGQVEQ